MTTRGSCPVPGVPPGLPVQASRAPTPDSSQPPLPPTPPLNPPPPLLNKKNDSRRTCMVRWSWCARCCRSSSVSRLRVSSIFRTCGSSACGCLQESGARAHAQKSACADACRRAAAGPAHENRAQPPAGRRVARAFRAQENTRGEAGPPSWAARPTPASCSGDKAPWRSRPTPPLPPTKAQHTALHVRDGGLAVALVAHVKIGAHRAPVPFASGNLTLADVAGA